MEYTNQNPQKKPTIKERLAQLNNVGKKALVIGRIGIATTIGAVGMHAWQKVHIQSPQKEGKNRIENIEKVEKKVEEQMPELVGTNTIGKVITDITKEIAKTGTDHGAKLRIAIAKWKATRNQEKE